MALGGINGWDVTALYNFHKNLGVMANGSFAYNKRKNRDEHLEGPLFHRHLFGEAGIGYYKGWGERRSTIALYTGTGWGNSLTDNTNLVGNQIYQKAVYHRYFIQPSVSVDLKHVNLSYGLRLSNVILQQFETQNGLQEVPIKNWFYETVTELSTKMEDFDFVTQVGFNAPFNDEKTNFHYRAFHISLGICYNLARGKE